jgi:hypothetical protein
VDLDYNISSRTKTTENVYWTVPNWNNEDESGLDQRTPNLNNIFSEVITQSLWQTGNSVTFIIDGTGRRSAYSHDNQPSKSPILHVYYRLNTAATEKFEMEDALKIYPNPASDVLYLDLQSFASGKTVNVTIHSTDGRELLRTALLAGDKHQLMSELPGYQGMVLISIEFEGKRIVRKHIIN